MRSATDKSRDREQVPCTVHNPCRRHRQCRKTLAKEIAKWTDAECVIVDKGVDAIREEFPETADKILKGGSGITKEFVASIPAMPDEQKIEAIEAVKSGPEAVAKFKKNATMEECNATPIVHTEAYNERDFANQVSGV